MSSTVGCVGCTALVQRISKQNIELLEKNAAIKETQDLLEQSLISNNEKDQKIKEQGESIDNFKKIMSEQEKLIKELREIIDNLVAESDDADDADGASSDDETANINSENNIVDVNGCDSNIEYFSGKNLVSGFNGIMTNNNIAIGNTSIKKNDNFDLKKYDQLQIKNIGDVINDFINFPDTNPELKHRCPYGDL